MEFENMKPGTLLAPVPAILCSVGSMEKGQLKQNLITLAWAGTVCSDPPMISVSIRKERFSYHQVMESKEFVVNLVGKNVLKATDYCGVKSGRDVDKFEKCNLTAGKVEGFSCAPYVKECPLYLACKVQHVLDLGSHTMFVGEIKQMGVQKQMMDETGKICFDKFELVAYNHGVYYELGKALGFFGYSVASQEVLKRRMKTL